MLGCAVNTTSAVSRGKLAAVVGGAGLHQHRLALRRARHVERAAHVEVLAVVIERVHLLRIEEQARLLVADEGVVVPRIPQRLHDLDEFLAAPVAHVLRLVRLVAEVERLGRIAGGDHVPAGAAAAHQIERGEFARHRVGLLEAGRGGADQADVLGVARERREHRERLDPGDIVQPVQALLVGGEHRMGVGAEHHVEQPALGGLRDLDHAGEILAGVGVAFGMPPRRDVVAAGPDEHSDLHLIGSFAHGGAPFLAVLRHARGSFRYGERTAPHQS